MKTTIRFLLILTVLLTACSPQSVATPSATPASTNKPLPSAAPVLTQTPEPKPLPIIHVNKIPIDSCPQGVEALQLIDARVSDAGILEVIYRPILFGIGGDGPEGEEPTGLFINSLYPDLWFWSEETQNAMPYLHLLPSDALGADVSTNRRWIVFRRDIEEYSKSELWVVDINGQNERKLATIFFDEIKSRNPDLNVNQAHWGYGWVPNRDKIYYYIAAGTIYDTFTLIDIPSGNTVPITQAREADKFIFAPDGSTIAILTASAPPQADAAQYSSQPAALLKGSELHMLNTNDGGVQFTLPIQIRIDSLNFSPDGKYVIGLSYDGIVSINLKDGTWQNIPLNYTTVSGTLPKFTWMDNSTILVPIINLPEGVLETDYDDLRDPNANFTIWKVNLTDASAQPVQTFSGVTYSVEFSPDGNHMVFRENGVQGLSSNGKYAAFHKPGVKVGGGGGGESPDLMLADLNTGNILATLKANKFFFWSPYPDLYIYDQIGNQVEGIHPWGIFLGQIDKDPIFIKLETGLSLFGPPIFFTADWLDAERFVMNVGCEISLVSLAYK